MAAATWLDTGGASPQTILRMANATGSISWSVAANAPSHDQSAGAAVTFTIAKGGGGGGLNPQNPDTLTLEIYADNDASTLLASITLSPTSASQSVTVFLSSTPGASGGAARCGMFRCNLHAINTTGGVGNTYNIDSDGLHTSVVTGGSVTSALSPTIRSNTTATLALSNSSGGSKPAKFAYSDPLWVQLALGCAPNNATEQVTLKVGTLSGSALTVTAATMNQQNGTIDNRFAASSNTLSTSLVIANATVLISGASVPWIVPTSTTNDSDTFDPRLSFTHLHQDNDNTFGTTPMTKDVGAQRLTSNLAFLGARVTNANGVGINGITFTQSLQDANHLITAETDSLTTATEGTEVGWGNGFLAWADQLPGGNWTKTCSITAPSGAMGLEQNASFTYQLIAANPNLRIICGGGPGTVATDTKHFVAGDPFIAGLAIFDTEQNILVEPDSGTALIALGRLNLATGKAEYLASDSVTWTDAGAATTGSPVFYFTATETFAGSKVWVVTFTGTNTSGWGVADIFAIGKAKVGGVPVSSMQKEILVSGINNHDKYKLNPINFVMG